MGDRILLSPPEVNGVDRAYVLDAIDSGWVAPVGPHLDAFEAEVAALCGRRFGVGLASGTAGIHLALRELGVGPGDEVLAPTLTFIGSVNPVVHLGARPFFVDSEPGSWNLSPEIVAEELEARRRAGVPAPKAAVSVDLYGQCCDYTRLLPVLEDHGVALVEDAAEALGATWADRPAGSFGAIGIVSFNGNKIVTTSGGGMVVTDDDAVARHVRHVATQAREPVVHYEHEEFGFNERLSNLLAAFGRGQLTDLDRRVARRREIADRYAAALAPVAGVAVQPEAAGGRSNRWLTCITIDPAVGVSPEQVRTRLAAAEIETRPTWKPMHLQPVFAGVAARLDGTAERVFATGLCLPSGSGLTDADLDRVVDALLEVLTD